MIITGIFALPCALLMLVLTMRVASYRHKNQLSRGNANDGKFERWIRAHGNAVEQIPISLILMALAESLGAPAFSLYIIGSTLIIGRCLHAWQFSMPNIPLICRGIGMGLTMLSQIIAIATLFLAIVF